MPSCIFCGGSFHSPLSIGRFISCESSSNRLPGSISRDLPPLSRHRPVANSTTYGNSILDGSIFFKKFGETSYKTQRVFGCCILSDAGVNGLCRQTDRTTGESYINHTIKPVVLSCTVSLMPRNRHLLQALFNSIAEVYRFQKLPPALPAQERYFTASFSSGRPCVHCCR